MIAMEINQVYEGFKLEQIVELNEISSKGYLFTHEKSNGKLMKIQNDDDNKVFSIGFRTPPEDSTGVAHILEHSVLCGSRKFDTKEPFVELLKGSLNTFLNAMTFPDKTIYPVASRNEKDFFNLMDVYLDAVLYPNIYKHEEIFMQEGWHYKLEDKNSPLVYNGVVYNEMKGAYSSPDSILYRKVPETLFPTTTYKYSSGGDPKEIPNLTYEKFLDFHRKYYHPSNSFIMLYGNGDLNKELKFINHNYLNDFDKISIDSEIKTQKAQKEMVEKQHFYGISKEDNLKDKTFLSMNYVIGESTDRDLSLAFEVLDHLLLTTPAAPLKKALIDNGIGNAISGSFNNSIKQPIFSITAKGANDADKEKFKRVINNTLSELVEKGIDKTLIEASINKLEFQLREGDFEGYPKGLIYYMRVMESWLYGGNPFTHLQYDEAFKNIKKGLTTDYFEKLIEKYLLNNTHSSLVMLSPVRGQNEKDEDELVNKLEKIKASMSESEIENIISRCEKLKERQSTPDTKEALESIPLLSLKDIDKNAERLPLEETEHDGLKVLYHKIHTNKIGYVNLYFNTKAIEQENIQYIRLLSDVLGKINTKNYDYGTLSNLININVGEVYYNPISYSLKDKSDGFTPLFTGNIKVLSHNFSKALELISETISNTNFDDENRLLQLIKEIKARTESSLINNGHRIAMRRAISYVGSKGYYDEQIFGLSYYKFLCNLEKEFENNKNNIISNLKQTSSKIFNKNNLIIGFTGDEEDYNLFKESINKITDNLSKEELKYNEYKFNLEMKNEGLLTQGNVQYVAKAGDFKKDGFKYSGAFEVLESILGYDYLWNNVRVKGGAYGVFADFRRNGNSCIVSYRDPNIKETLDVYDSIGAYLKDFNCSDREMQKYIIGTIRKLDQPLSNSSKGDFSDMYYFAGITHEDLQREREEVINTNVDTIRGFKPLVDSVMSQGYICTLGNENKIIENKNIFKNLIKVIE